MLVLTRKPAEMIQIGDDIVVKVIKTAKGSVKIGIEAPANVRVIRSELVDRKADKLITATPILTDTTSGSLAKTELKAHVA